MLRRLNSCTRLLVFAALIAASPAVAQSDEPADESTTPTLPRVERSESGRSLARRPDERRPAVQYSTLLFGGPLTLGGEHEIVHQNRWNFDLDRDVARNRGRLDQELKLELFHRTTEDLSIFLQMVGFSEIDTYRSTGARTSEHWAERGQMWLYWDRPLGAPLALQVGRSALIEPRTWWWDEDLDAVRVYLGGGDWLIETGIGRELGRVSTLEDDIDPEQERVTRWFGRAAYRWRGRHTIEAYWLHARDGSSTPQPGTLLREDARDESDANLRWHGIRLQGEERFKGGPRVGYWLDAALLRGRETLTTFRDAGNDRVRVNRSTGQKVRGDAFDAGMMLRLRGSWRPTFTLAYARGSGDDEGGDGIDRAFRQTGLQENKGRFGGVNRFRYYGEMLRPDLSNLAISTLAFGFRFLPRSSLEFALHDYRQVHPSRTLPSDRLDASPDGRDRDIGRELDIVLGIRESQRVEYAVAFGLFRAGKAFGPRAGEHARFLEFKLTWIF